jgi:hypothetical protein
LNNSKVKRINDNAGSLPGEIKFVGIDRVSDKNLLLMVASEKTKKAYSEEVLFRALTIYLLVQKEL